MSAIFLQSLLVIYFSRTSSKPKTTIHATATIHPLKCPVHHFGHQKIVENRKKMLLKRAVFRR
jgi:hypothetical protein